MVSDMSENEWGPHDVASQGVWGMESGSRKFRLNVYGGVDHRTITSRFFGTWHAVTC